MATSDPNQQASQRPLIGIFGGTFDPIHMGHLRMALELKQRLAMDEMRLIPCHLPPHRQLPHVDAEQRAVMAELAVEHCPDLVVDRLELANPEPSYSFHTLQALRAQLGPDVALCLAMGMDSLASLHTWYEWDRLADLAHIVVVARPGWTVPDEGPVRDYISQHQGSARELRKQPAGILVIEELTQLPISSTAIRSQVAQGQSPQFLLPDSVWAYILRHRLYQREAE